MRVLVIAQYFPPETGAAPARLEHFARSLAEAGHDVRVITGLPNHPSGEIRPGYSRPARGMPENGVAVDRVWLYATPRKTTLRRLLNHASFAISALPACLRGPRPAVVLASVPPPFLGVTAWIAAIWHRAPLVLDCRDDWPRAALALGEMRPGLAAGLLDRMVRFLQRRAARVLAVTPGMRRHLASRGIDERRIELLSNGADTTRFRPHAGDGNGGNGGHGGNGMHANAGFTVLYAGTHGLVHGMEAVLDAAVALRSRAEVRFLLIGDGVAKADLERRAREAGLANVVFRPSLPPDELVDVIRAADVCVATTRAHPFCGETVPVKLFDYLACGRPVVAAVLGDAAEVVTASGAGIVVPPEDGAALAHALETLALDAPLRARLAAAGPPFIERSYSRRATGAALARLLDQVRIETRGRDVAARPGGAYRGVKRAIDLVVAAALLVLLAPLMIAIAIAVRFDSPGPSLFRQRRIGRGSSEFRIFKFRTMRLGTPDLASHLIGPGSGRVTRLGKFLRRSSLDELPQLLNVLRGEMSLVGPRPALHNQYDLIAMRQAEGIDALKPGLTGWAQIHGRDDIPMDLKVEHDRTYLERVSPALDLAILARTPGALLSSRGVF